jgi:hypothetical protein
VSLGITLSPSTAASTPVPTSAYVPPVSTSGVVSTTSTGAAVMVDVGVAGKVLAAVLGLVGAL